MFLHNNHFSKSCWTTILLLLCRHFVIEAFQIVSFLDSSLSTDTTTTTTTTTTTRHRLMRFYYSHYAEDSSNGQKKSPTLAAAETKSRLDDRSPWLMTGGGEPFQSSVPTSTRRRQFLKFAYFGCLSSSATSSIIFACYPSDANAASPKQQQPQQQQQPLIDARTLLDLAVQASSVQAWSDAVDIVNDDILDEGVLEKAFQDEIADVGSSVEKMALLKDYQSTCIDGIRNLRDILLLSKSNKSLPTEDAMSVMKFGTNARVALDSFLEAVK